MVSQEGRIMPQAADTYKSLNREILKTAGV